MALHSLSNQDTSNNNRKNKEVIYSGQNIAGEDAKINYIEGYQRMSRCFEGVGVHNMANDEPDSVVGYHSSNDANRKYQLINNLITSLQFHTSQEMFQDSGVRSLNPLMEWEGSVEGIEGDEFVARLCNVTTGELLPTEEARFPISDLNDIQRENLKVGAIFRWVIGLQRLPNGNKQRVSELFFRRLPAHSEKEISTIIESIGKQLDAQEWNDAPSR